MEAATQNDAEARRFQELLRKRGDVDLLMRLLDARLKLAQDAAARGRGARRPRPTCWPSARASPRRRSTALLTALGLAPDDDALHEQARKLAARARRARPLPRARERARRRGRAASATTRARTCPRDCCCAWARRSSSELRDYDRARGLYAQGRASGGTRVVDAWLAIARVAGARGDTAEQRRVLQRIAEARQRARSAAEQRREALFAAGRARARQRRLARRRRAVARARARRRDRLRARQGRAARARSNARPSTQSSPRCSSAWRAPRAITRCCSSTSSAAPRARTPALDELREGIELALRLREYARAERMLKRLLDRGAAAGDARARELGATRGCPSAGVTAGDCAGAIAYLQPGGRPRAGRNREPTRCAASSAGSRARRGDLEVAASAYARLLERDSEDAAVAAAARHLPAPGRPRALRGLRRRVPAPAAARAPIASRCTSRAREFLIEVAGDERAAVPALKAALEDDPATRDATDLLTHILQKQGMNEELAELLQSHFDRARDEQNQPAIAELGLRIAELYGDRRPEAAIDMLRSAL